MMNRTKMLLSPRVIQVGIFIGFFVFLSIFMTEIEAFEWFFEFTRDHEDWDLDELVAVALSALITGAIWFGIDARNKGREIKKIYDERLKNEKRMSDARRVQALGTLAGGVAHSGNNLMQPVLTLARLSKNQLEDGHPVHGHLDRILVAAQSAGDLFHSILKFSRDETEFAQRIDLAALIRENKTLLMAAVTNQVKLNFSLSETPVIANISNNNLLDILLVLISNSADAYKAGAGEIDIVTQNKNAFSQLIVRDHGCGISEADFERIFEPFFTNKDVGQGTGLGLSIVKSLVAEARGEIHVASQVGEGTSVTVNFPAATLANKQEEPSQ